MTREIGIGAIGATLAPRLGEARRELNDQSAGPSLRDNTDP